ncbi:MAG TPA: cytochrome P450 [Nannocystis exedens]|nr:cytochrome P450 [Nannocystis exedens]
MVGSMAMTKLRATRIPGPRPLPLIGNVLRFRRHGLLMPYLRDWRYYGDVLLYRFGPAKLVAVCHPDELRQIFIKRRDRYAKGTSVLSIVPLLGDGLFVADGEHWQRQRRLLHRLFTANAVRAHERAMLAAIEALLDRWRILPPGETVDIFGDMSHLAMDVICRTMFGVAADNDIYELGHAVTEAFSWVGEEGLRLLHLPVAVPTPRNRRFLRAKTKIHNLLQNMISRRRARGRDQSTADLLDLLLQASDEDSGEQMTDAQVINEVVTIFVAGHETTAVCLTWTWLLIAGHADTESKLHEELDRVLGNRSPTLADIPELRYTRQIIDESLRLYPPVWTDPREAVADDEIAGYPIRAGTVLMPVLYATHRHPDFWPDPERFSPERFSVQASKGRHPMAHAPFGGGPRVCLGMAFALQEMVLAIASIAQRFRLQRSYGTVMDMDALAGTLRPKWPALIDLHRRKTD